MKLPWPRSLFARLMLIWLIGISLVLVVSFALFVGERDRVGRDALFGVSPRKSQTSPTYSTVWPQRNVRAGSTNLDADDCA